jgi:putative transposase
MPGEKRPRILIAHQGIGIWLYSPLSLSYCDIEELLAERGVEIFYETVRHWVLKFGL